MLLLLFAYIAYSHELMGWLDDGCTYEFIKNCVILRMLLMKTLKTVRLCPHCTSCRIYITLEPLGALLTGLVIISSLEDRRELVVDTLP